MHAPSQQQLTWIARGMGLAMLVLAVFSVYVVSTCYDPPVDPYRLGALHEGATKDEVIAALGAPSSIEDDGRKWLYSRFMKVRVVQVLFDEDDLVVARGYTDEDLVGGDGDVQDRSLPTDAPLRFREVESDEVQYDAAPPDEEGGGITEVRIE
jgi:hypothetical protein